jgi:hypothetical protein
MNTRVASGVIAGIAAISIAVPAAGFADGGHSHAEHHSKRGCKMHRHYGRHEGFTRGHGKHHGFGKGKKCGFPGKGQTGSTGTTGETGNTGQTGNTGWTGWTGKSGEHRHSSGHRH